LETESEYFENMIIANKAAIPIKDSPPIQHTATTVNAFFPDVSVWVSSLLPSISINMLTFGKEVP